MLSQITKDGAAVQASDGIDPTLTPHIGSVLGPPRPEDAVRGLYVHVPFCTHKCHYCDFYSIVDALDRRDAWVDRAIDELAAARPWLGDRPLETVFVGGGTPTMLEPAAWDRLAAHLAPWSDDDTEFTVEANPETVTDDKLAALRRAGAGRLSVGAQSFDPRALAVLERHHEPESVGRALRMARRAGFTSVSLDLIFGVPGQSLADWHHDLDAVLALEPDHLSCYGLVYEPNTALTMRLRQGRIARIDEDLEADMYAATIDRLERAGFEQYEISNWARPGQRCRHNLLYWTGASWWPIGPAASGHVRGVRWRNVPRLANWLDSAPGLSPVVDVETADDDHRAGEAFMMGLRLLDGMPRTRVDAMLAIGTRRRQRATAVADEIERRNLEWHEGCLRLTARGLMVADSVVSGLL